MIFFRQNWKKLYTLMNEAESLFFFFKWRVRKVLRNTRWIIWVTLGKISLNWSNASKAKDNESWMIQSCDIFYFFILGASEEIPKITLEKSRKKLRGKCWEKLLEKSCDFEKNSGRSPSGRNFSRYPEKDYRWNTGKQNLKISREEL